MTVRQIQFYNQYKDYGLEILAIDLYRSETESTKAYIAERGINYPVLIADDAVLAAYGGIRTTPTMFLVDRSGKIIDLFDSFNKLDLIHMENKIRSLLGLGPLPSTDMISKKDLKKLESNRAPDFSLSTFDGMNIALSNLKGKAVLLNFWSVEDIISIGILSYQEAIYEKYRSKGLEVIGIHIDMQKEAIGKVVSFIKTNQIEIPIIQATPELLEHYGEIDTTPILILIDPYGYVREVYEQFNYEIVAQLEDNLLSLLKPLPSLKIGPSKDPAMRETQRLMEAKCARCHYLDRVLLRGKTKEEWAKTVYRMREKSLAWISQQEAEEIIAYLSQLRPQ